MRVVLIGPPGAGKATQAEFIAKHFRVPNISTGHIFRSHVSGDTDLGPLAKKFMGADDLVPDEVTNAMVRDRLAQSDAAGGGHGRGRHRAGYGRPDCVRGLSRARRTPLAL
jgi:adenylate kinase